MRRGAPPAIQVPEAGAEEEEEEEGGVSMMVGSARARGPSTASRCFNARTPLPSKRDREGDLVARVKAARLRHADAPRRTVARRRAETPSPPSDATQQNLRTSESEEEAAGSSEESESDPED